MRILRNVLEIFGCLLLTLALVPMWLVLGLAKVATAIHDMSESCGKTEEAHHEN